MSNRREVDSVAGGTTSFATSASIMLVIIEECVWTFGSCLWPLYKPSTEKHLDYY